MAGKKTEKDLLSDFFGDDDLDWLDDDARQSQKAAEAAAAAAAAEPDPEPAPTPEPAAERQATPKPPPPPPPVPRRPAPHRTLPPTPSPELRGAEVEPAPKRTLRRGDTSDEPEPQESLVAAPAEPLAAGLGDTLGVADPGRDSLDETIGAFLEPLSAEDSDEADPESLVTVTDHHAQGVDDIVVEEDRPEDLRPTQPIADLDGDADAAVENGASSPDPVEDDPADDAASSADEADDDETADAAAVEDTVGEDTAAVEDTAGADETEGEDEDDAADDAADDGPDADADADADVEALAGPAVPRATWQPMDDASTWAEVVTIVEAAALGADGDAKVALLLDAARIRTDRLGDLEGANTLLTHARAAGSSDALLEARVDVATRRGDLAVAVEALIERAGALEGPAAAEAYQAAAMIARHRLGELESAESHLRSAIAADPKDYASLSLLRDQLSAKGREADRVEVLGHISELASGRIAAEAWWELGRLKHRLGDEDGALVAYRSGREADPTHGPCFLAIQALAVASADDLALGTLYLEEAAREGAAEGGHWSLEAARAFVDARDHEQADAAFAGALAAGHPMAAREQQAWFIATDRAEAYADAVHAEAQRSEAGPEKAFSLFRLGRAREDLGQLEAAMVAYREAVELDPTAGPAAEGVARVLLAAGKHEDLLTFWQARVDGSENPVLQRSVLLRMAEVAQTGLSDDARTRALLERLLADHPNDRPALQMLRRIYQRLEAWPELAQTYLTLAQLDEESGVKAQHLARAGLVWRIRVGDTDKAREAFGEALELVPGHVIALDEQVDLLEEIGDWPAQAQVLRAASDSLSDTGERVRTAYHAGQVYLDRLDDVERAAEAFRQCVRLTPDYLPALGMLKQIAARAGQGTEVYRLYLQQADAISDASARNWRMLAAADLASRLPGGDAGRDLGAILENDPQHAGAVAGQELRMLTMGAKVGLLNLYRRLLVGVEGAERAPLLVRVAHLFEALGDTAGVQAPLAEAVQLDASGVPYRALARLAEGQRLWTEAADALEKAGEPVDRLERARLLAQRLGRHEEALGIYAELLDNPDVAVGAALGAAALAQRAGDANLLLRAHAMLAEHANEEPVRAAHALWSGQLAEAGGSSEEALRLYSLALSLRPNSLTAFDGARRNLLETGNAEGLKRLWAEHRPHDAHALALDLEQVGDAAAVAEVWETEAKDRGLDTTVDVGLITRLEVARAGVQDWRGVYSAVSQRIPLIDDAGVTATAEAKRRWLLAEKLADTEEAWELYQRLHEEDPEDREVISALAGIALARGETRLATTYLDSLAQGAEGPEAAADLRVRSAEVHRSAEEFDSARQAYLDALDHVPSHGPALDGLKSLARGREDWSGLLATLKREASLAQGAARVDLLVNIAETTADKLDDVELAKDAWRAVLDEDPTHREALEALTGLSAEHEDWEGYLQHGLGLAEQLEGEEKTSLLGRLGAVAADELGRDDASSLLERAVTEGPVDLEAARRLEALYRGAGDSTNTVRILVLQSQAVDETSEKVRLLGDAAELEAEVRGDRADAARLFAQVLDIEPNDLRALRFMCEYRWDAGKRDDGVLDLHERLAPRAEEDLDTDDFDVAMELSTFYFHAGTLLAERERHEEALEMAAKALSHSPNHRPTLELQAPIFVAREQWDEANSTLKRLLQLTGGAGDKGLMADIYAQLGLVEHAMGRASKATKRFVKALDLVPNHVLALKGQARLLEDQQQWTAVLNVHNSIIYNAPKPTDVTAAYLTKGRILDQQLNRPDKAAQHYERSLAYDANQPKVLLRMAELSLRREDWGESSSAASRGLQLARGGPLRIDLLLCDAIARGALGDAERAAAATAEAVELAEELGDESLAAAIRAADPLSDLADAIRERLPS